MNRTITAITLVLVVSAMLIGGLFNPALANRNTTTVVVNEAGATNLKKVAKKRCCTPLGGQHAADSATARENAKAITRIKAAKAKVQADAEQTLVAARNMVKSGKVYASSNDPRNCAKVIDAVGQMTVPVIGNMSTTFVINQGEDEHWACDVTSLATTK